MSNLDWSQVDRVRKPSKKQIALYRQWVKYLSDSKLSEASIQERAKAFAEQGQKVPKE
jgi:hypothetical protein